MRDHVDFKGKIISFYKQFSCVRKGKIILKPFQALINSHCHYIFFKNNLFPVTTYAVITDSSYMHGSYDSHVQLILGHTCKQKNKIKSVYTATITIIYFKPVL